MRFDQLKNEELRAPNRALLEKFLGFIGRQEYNEACALFTDDVLADFPYLPSAELVNEYRGRDAVKAFISSSKEMGFTPYNFEITAVFDLAEPNRLIAEYRTGAGSMFKPTGAAYENRYIGIFEFRDGQISFWREYLNPMVALNILKGVGAAKAGG